jgi:hypothetical protein
MYHKKYVCFDVGMLLKSNGFDRETEQFYSKRRNGKPYVTDSPGYDSECNVITNWNNGMGSYPTKPDEVECSAPEIWIVVDWFLTTRNIFIEVIYDNKESKFYSNIKFISSEKIISLRYNKDYISKNMYEVYNNTFKYILKDRFQIDHNNVN